MDEFKQYLNPPIPTFVQEVRFTLSSLKIPEIIDNIPTGNYLIEEIYAGGAFVADEEGVLRWKYVADSKEKLINTGIVTVSNLATIETWLQSRRTIIEEMVLP